MTLEWDPMPTSPSTRPEFKDPIRVDTKVRVISRNQNHYANSSMPKHEWQGTLKSWSGFGIVLDENNLGSVFIPWYNISHVMLAE